MADGMRDDFVPHWRKAFGTERLRAIVALLIVAVGYFLQDPVLGSPYHLLRDWLSIPKSPAPHVLVCAAYLLLVTLRLLWWLAFAGLVFLIDRDGISRVLRADRRQASYCVRGLGIGLAVMAGTVLAIAAVGDAQISSAPGTFLLHDAYGSVWLLGEGIGAAGEEILFRGLIFILVARLCGTKAALLVSALAFALVHGANPGASWIWMVRLVAAGLLLAYSVLRSGSLWWAVGYHAGWNWSSAPLFGAAGSGYSDEGHIFSFLPRGSDWITGGAVGPEGSVFAFVAVVVATVLLLMTMPARETPELML